MRVDRARDVFRRLMAHVFEGKAKLGADGCTDRLRDTYAAWLRQRLQARRDIHSVAVDVAPVLYDVP